MDVFGNQRRDRNSHIRVPWAAAMPPLMRSWPVLILLVACSSDDRGVDGDPRCASICKIVVPPLDGAYEVCSEASSDQCLTQCNLRVANVSDTCGTCLLEDASFSAGPIDAEAVCDQSGTCTIDGPGGSCTYVAADDEDRDRCTRIAFPREIVSCSASFTAAGNCSTNCS